MQGSWCGEFELQLRRTAKLQTVPARRDGSVEKLLCPRHPSVQRRQVLQLEFEFGGDEEHPLSQNV